MTANNRADLLRWDRLIDFTTVLPGQAVLLSFELLLSSDPVGGAGAGQHR